MNKGYYNMGTRFILLCDKICLRLLPNENVSRELLETENYLEILENQIAQLEEEKFEMELKIDSLNFTFFLSLACGLLSTGDMIINISNAASNPSLKVFIAYLIKCAVVYSSCKLAIFSAKKRKEILTDLKINTVEQIFFEQQQNCERNHLEDLKKQVQSTAVYFLNQKDDIIELTNNQEDCSFVQMDDHIHLQKVKNLLESIRALNEESGLDISYFSERELNELYAKYSNLVSEEELEKMVEAYHLVRIIE